VAVKNQHHEDSEPNHLTQEGTLEVVLVPSEPSQPPPSVPINYFNKQRSLRLRHVAPDSMLQLDFIVRDTGIGASFHSA
jgi:hypothetical protein